MNPKEYSLFQNSPFPKVNRAGTATKQKNKKPYKELGRDAKIDPDIYYRIKQENEQLKQTKLSLNQKILKLEASIINLKENILKERRQADYKYPNHEKNNQSDFNFENEKLKEELEKKNLIIKGLQLNYKLNQPKKKKIPKKKDELTKQEINNDNLALIAHLRKQLKIANEDRKNLMYQIKNINEAYSNINKNNNINAANNYSINNNNKNKEMISKMADLNTNYESAQMKLDTQNKILEMTKKSLTEYMDKYDRERENNRKMETELALLKGQIDQIENYKKLLEEKKINEIKLEEEINELRISPFIKQAEERGNVYRNLQICQKNLTETKKNLDEKEKLLTELEFKVDSLENENKQLKESLDIEKIEKEKYRDEALKLKISRVEREKSDKLYQDKLNQFNQYGEIESNYNNILSLYQRQNDELNWGNINFIEQELIQNKDPKLLLAENERLKSEKSTMGKELENTKNMLLIQQQLNTDYKRDRDFENEKNKSEIKYLKKKIEDLCKLIDAKNMPKDNSSLIYNSTYKYPKTMPLIKKPNISSEDKDKDIEESQEETEVELTMNENALDVYFGECIFEDALEVELGYNMDDILSFFSVDFYMHETQTSDILAGKNPMFNFQILFKVDVNEPLLNYLENEYMNIELYSLRDNAQIALGEGKISLKELLKMGENVINSGKKIINSECDIFYKKNKNLKIATIHYQMRMIKPLSEALKWYYQQNKYNEEGDKYQESIKLSSGLNLNEYANIGKKAYEVKILITKAINLIIQGPPRRIAPYIYYEFYKNGGRYSKNGEGMNPIFEDMASYNEIMTQEFLDYITKNALNVYIFDSMNQIEIDMDSPNEAFLVSNNQQISKDLIGICKVPLQNLLVNDIIQGEFPIYNMKDEKVGSLVINIKWEEININNESINLMRYNEDISENKLVLKLAECLKQKGLNVESAFNIFDIDGKNEISLENFKNTLLFTLKFTTNQNEMEHLIKLLYTSKGKNVLDKADFYKIFGNLLPREDIKYKTQFNPDLNLSNNNNINNISNKENLMENTQPMIKSENNIRIENNLSNNNTEVNNSIIKDRSLEDIGLLIIKFTSGKKGDYDAVDLFKDIFDKDASLGIDKKELYKGFEKMGIRLNNNELDNLWKKISDKKDIIEFSDFKAFHDNYCKKPSKKKDNNIGNDKMSGTQMSEPFLTNNPD